MSGVPETGQTYLPKSTRRKILLAVAAGTFMGPLDSSVVNIALPSLRDYFGVALSTVEWVVLAYLLVVTCLLLTFGRMGDLYGHKRIYLGGFGVFTVGSLLCGIAPTIWLLVAARVLQAVGAGMMMSMGPAIITAISPPQERGRAMGVTAVAVSVALTTGPILGGFLVSAFGWQSIFLINIPIGILVILYGRKVIPSGKGHETQPFDVTGAVLLFLALFGILFPLSYSEKAGWHNPVVLGIMAAGVVLMAAFILLEFKISYPMVDMKLFKNRLYSMGNLSSLLSYLAQFSVIFIMPFYLQEILGLKAAQAGLLIIPMPVTTMLVAPLAGSLSDRVDTRYISSLGMLINTLGLWLLANLHPASATHDIIIALMVNGLGSGLFQTPNNSAVMGTVPPNRRGTASGMLATMRNMGMVMGVAISAAIFTSRQNLLTSVLKAQGLAGAQLKVQAFTGAMHVTFMVGAGLALAAALTSMVRGSIYTGQAPESQQPAQGK